MKFRQLSVSVSGARLQAGWADITASADACGAGRAPLPNVWLACEDAAGVNHWLDHWLDSRLVDLEASLDNLRGLETS